MRTPSGLKLFRNFLQPSLHNSLVDDSVKLLGKLTAAAAVDVRSKHVEIPQPMAVRSAKVCLVGD